MKFEQGDRVRVVQTAGWRASGQPGDLLDEFDLRGKVGTVDSFHPNCELTGTFSYGGLAFIDLDGVDPKTCRQSLVSGSGDKLLFWATELEFINDDVEVIE